MVSCLDDWSVVLYLFNPENAKRRGSVMKTIRSRAGEEVMAI